MFENAQQEEETDGAQIEEKRGANKMLAFGLFGAALAVFVALLYLAY